MTGRNHLETELRHPNLGEKDSDYHVVVDNFLLPNTQDKEFFVRSGRIHWKYSLTQH